MPTGTITALTAQEHDPQRVNVFIDGTFALGVSLNTLAREGLYVGHVLDATHWDRLEMSERADRALYAAMRQLSTRPRSMAEIRDYLGRKGYPPEVIDATVDRLVDLGMLDDAAFARFWVENRRTFRPRGALALRNELRRKGVERDTIEATLTEEAAEADNDEGRSALALARTALRKYADAPDKPTFQRRLGGYLQRRGFTVSTIMPILDQLWHELRDQANEQEAHTVAGES